MEDSSILKSNRKIAAFGFRYIPPKEGSAGADKFAMELYPALLRKVIRLLRITGFTKMTLFDIPTTRVSCYIALER